jgi:dienelactone hydrolase
MMNILPEPDRLRQVLYGLLGDLPPRDGPITVRLVEQGERDGYLLEKLILKLNGSESVPAYFVKPIQSEGRIPCLLYNHAHGGDYRLGKDELLLGRKELSAPPYAQALTSMGWGALCIDAWIFGERHARSESEVFKEMLWKGQVLWGMMVYDSLRALDYLLARPDVNGDRIGTIGMSMGSTMAWWIAALDPRVKVCVDISCMTDYEALIAAGGLDGHGIYYYVPSLLKHFSTARINTLIAPRPHLSLAGNLDPLTPPEGLDRIDRELRQVYTELGAKDAWEMRRYESGHVESMPMRKESLAFLEKWL